MKVETIHLNKNSELISYVLLLRYGSSKIHQTSKPILSLHAISKVVKVSTRHLSRLIQIGIDSALANKAIQPKPISKFTSDHIDYLLDPNILRQWAHLSLKQRAVMFHRRFPNIKISATSIQRIYHQGRVKYKYINRVKKEIDFSVDYYRNLFIIMYGELQDAQRKKLKVIFIDEAVFTFSTFNTKAWSPAYSSIRVLESQIKVKAQAIVAGISLDSGLEHFLLSLKSINTDSFIQFLQELSNKYDNNPLVLFMDNLQVHKSNEVKEAYGRLNITPIYNIPYSPQFNGIESYFSLLKGEYKKLLLQALMNGLDFDVVKLIKRSLKIVHDNKTMACVRNGIDAIEKQYNDIQLTL